MNIEYRLACLSDINEVMELVKDSIIAMEKNKIFQWDHLYPTEEDFLEDIKHESLYIGLNEGKIVVIYALDQQCDEAYKNGKWRYPDTEYFTIHRLCVNAHFQNMGIGKRAMHFIEEKLRTKGIQVIRLDVFGQNPYALHLYENMGYYKVGCADWRKGRFFLMEKHIS